MYVPYTLQRRPLNGQKGDADALETTTALLLLRSHLVRPGCESLAHLNSFRVKIEKTTALREQFRSYYIPYELFV